MPPTTIPPTSTAIIPARIANDFCFHPISPSTAKRPSRPRVDRAEAGESSHAQKREQDQALRPRQTEALPCRAELDQHHDNRRHRYNLNRPKRVQLLENHSDV